MSKENEKTPGSDFYRIKTEYIKEGEKGELYKAKVEELVLATSYTEAEKVAYGIVEDQNRTQYGSVNIEIVKTKIKNVIQNDVMVRDDNSVCETSCDYFEESEDTGVGLYSVKALIITLDERTGKEKKSSETFFVPAISNSDATTRIKEYLNESIDDYVIRDTRFDKAEAIYWPKIK